VYHEADGPPSAVGAVAKDWLRIVTAEIRIVSIALDQQRAGPQTLTLWGMSTGIVLQRIWVDIGGILAREYSYLGPPESLRV